MELLNIITKFINMDLLLYGLPGIKYKVESDVLKMYKTSYRNIYSILCENPTGNIANEDLTIFQNEEEKATLNLDSKTVELIRDIRNIAVALYIFYESKEKNEEKHRYLLEKWSYYKAHLSEYYRKRIVSEPLGWLKFKGKL